MDLSNINLYDSLIDFQEENNLIKYPLDLEELCRKNNWVLLPYPDKNKEEFMSISEDGFSVLENGKYVINYNKDVKYKGRELFTRVRFTIAHEIGHIVLGHHFFNKDYYDEFENIIEKQADTFAGNLLVPSIILHKYDFLSKHKEIVQDLFFIGEACCKCRLDLYKTDILKCSVDGLKYSDKFLGTLLNNINNIIPSRINNHKLMNILSKEVV